MFLLAAAAVLATSACGRDGPKDEMSGPPVVKETQVWQTGFDPETFLARAPEQRRAVARALGLSPWPERTSLTVRDCGRLDSPDFTLEKIEYTSRPGFPVTALLYVPKKLSGRVPAVLNLHGHWPGGKRSEQVRMRCAQMARMGLVAMAIDAYGVPGEGNERGLLGGSFPNESLAEGLPGYLFAAGIHVAAISVWDAVRAIDYLAARPEVDPSRILTCGASWGATQALLTAIVDERVFGAVGVLFGSTFTPFPGNHSCELIPGILKDATTQERLALLVPRPLLLVQHFHAPPYIHQTVALAYEKAGAKDRFTYEEIITRHDFNRTLREAVYRWLNRVLFGLDEPVSENPNFPFRDQDLFCNPGGRVGPEALSTEDLLREVERNVGREVPRPTPATAKDWPRRRDESRRRLAQALGYDPKALRLGFDFEMETIDPATDPASLARHPALAGGAGVVLVVPKGETPKSAVLFVGAPADVDRVRKEGVPFAVLSLSGVERRYHEARQDWRLAGRTDAQNDYATNAISIIYGEPHVFRKVWMIGRAVERLAAESGVPADRIEVRAAGRESNLALLAAVLDDAVGGPLQLEDLLFSYLRRGDRFPPLAIMPPGILRHVDVDDLVALCAPRPVSILSGRWADDVRPVPGDAGILPRAQDTYIALGARDRLVFPAGK